MANKTFQFGPSSCGKTVLLAVMAKQFAACNEKIRENGFYLVSERLGDSNELTDLYDEMIRGKFPPGTLPGTYRAFNFKVFYNNADDISKEVPQLNFTIFDYAGEEITDGKGELVNRLGEEFTIADQQIIVIDGFALLNHFKIKDFGELNLGTRRFSEAKFLNMLTRCRTQNKQAAVVISKCDYVTKYISMGELIRKTKEKFNDSLPKGTVIIPVSSTGSGVTEDGIISDEAAEGDEKCTVHRLVGRVANPTLLKPLHIDVLLSFVFTRFMRREQNKLRSEIETKIRKIESDANMDITAIEREMKEQIEKLSRIPGSAVGKVFANIFESFKKVTGIGETKEEKIRRLRKELSKEIERIGKEKGALKEKYENNPELKEYAEILDAVNQKYRKFLENYPEALVE